MHSLGSSPSLGYLVLFCLLGLLGSLGSLGPLGSLLFPSSAPLSPLPLLISMPRSSHGPVEFAGHSCSVHYSLSALNFIYQAIYLFYR